MVPLCYTSASVDHSMRHTRGCTSTALIPNNLHVNWEARRETLKHYSLSFNLPHAPEKIFFDPSVDILYFGEREEGLESFKQFSNTVAMVSAGELSKVRRLAVSEHLFWGIDGLDGSTSVSQTKEFWESVRRKFDGLEEILFVLTMKTTRDNMQQFREKRLGQDELLKARVLDGLDSAGKGQSWTAPSWKVVEAKEIGLIDNPIKGIA
ncbi:hypothetical protein B7494_g8105 [Chlorociboria aeruginascens]|nr:hypothetical protein B7494_g8105 [Chlorociboria aeruginascens]